MKPKTLIELVSGMMVSSIVNGGCGLGNRSRFKEINNENVLFGTNLICQSLPN